MIAPRFIFAAILLSATTAAQAQDLVRVGVSVRNVVLMPYYYANDKGYFEREGLKGEIIQIRSNLQVAGVASGELDFMSGVGTAIDAARRGAPLKVLAVLYRAPLFSLVSGATIKRPKDLEGKKVGVSRIGSESHNGALWMLSQNGVDAKKVTFIQTGSTIVSMIGVQQNSLDASVLSPPFTGEMVAQGFKVLAKTADVAESPFNGMVTSQEQLRSRPERIRKALKALLDAYRRIRQERAATIEYIRQSFKVSEKIAENSYNEIREVMLDDMIMPEERLKKAIDGPYARGEGEKRAPISEMVDYSILRSLR
ncbi:MAG TPA: ABC transporter substrate-binding protein [Candidatus Binatus sp.]|nr:ABC transporter substrate-binding protein [Candidatus Binatus sp.]